MKTVTIYTDGACSGNPGPGGWGAILRYNGAEKELFGGAAQTTNNRMELTGVISALGTQARAALWSCTGFKNMSLTRLKGLGALARAAG